MADLESHSFLEFAELHNLGLIISFYNDHKALVKDRLEKLDKNLKDDETSANERDKTFWKKQDYMGWYHEFMRNNLFVMLYSHLEEFIARETRTMTGRDPGHRTLEQFKANLREHFQIQIKDHCDWDFIIDCSKARHILLHRRGNTSLAKDPGSISQLCQRNANCFEIISCRMVVTDNCNARFSREIQVILKFVVARLHGSPAAADKK